jgi:hypothetical protein
VPKHLKPKEGPLYFPTKIGAKWVWQCGEEEDTEIVSEVEKQPDGTKHVTVGHVKPNGDVISVRTVVVSNKGLYQLNQGGHVFGTSYCLLKMPHQPGDTWKNEKPAFWDRTCTVYGPEWVEVPAGRFWALRVEEDEYRIPNKLSKTTTWYAPGVGPVKMTTDNGAHVLKSFSPSKE